MPINSLVISIRGVTRKVPTIKARHMSHDEFSGHGYTSLPKPDESESGQMVLK